MDPTEIGLFRLAEQRLAWVDQRQALLSQNVSNADTPNYTPQDLAPFASRLGLALAATDGAHFGATGRPNSFALARTRPHERAPDGNAVSLEDQLGRVADTASTQALVVNLYRKYAGLLRTALGHTG